MLITIVEGMPKNINANSFLQRPGFSPIAASHKPSSTQALTTLPYGIAGFDRGCTSTSHKTRDPQVPARGCETIKWSIWLMLTHHCLAQLVCGRHCLGRNSEIRMFVLERFFTSHKDADQEGLVKSTITHQLWKLPTYWVRTR